VFNMGGTRDPVTGTWSGLASLEMVAVGDPGNAGEHSGYDVGGYGPDRICGAVDYTFNLGKYEVTAGQYTEFLNAKAKSDPYGLYNTRMWSDVDGCKIQQNGTSGNYTYSVASDLANRPVNWVSFWDGARFTNWLGNGQSDGDTETGSYTLNGYNGGNWQAVTRNAGATWFVPNEDEWYKAAYYDPNKTGGAGYWDYPTCSNTAPGQDMTDVSGNNANCYTSPFTFPIDSGKYYTTVVGEFQNSASPYGTFDQGGNVWEWNELIAGDASLPRGLIRGGSYSYAAMYMPATYRYYYWGVPINEDVNIGFRVASVPEPGSISLLVVGAVSLLAYGWRRRR
jgi:formylglycine-generating enzyme